MRYRFGEFELRPDQGELRQRGRLIAIQPQPLKVLTVLVSRSGDLVRRKELHEEVWGSETHVDFDRGLNYCIKQIRVTLGDDAADPRFIRTLPRLGYKFIAEVRGDPDDLPIRPRSMLRRASLAAAAGVVLLLLTLTMTWWFAPAGSDTPPTDPRALQAFLRGSYLAEQGSPEDTEESLGLFEQAAAIDPSFARAHLAQAQTWVRMPRPPAETKERSRTAVLRALELDPGLAEAHAHLATLRFYGDWDWPGADASFRRSVELEPDSARVRQGYASFLSQMGRHEEAIAQVERAMALDPVSTAIKADAGWFYYQARRYEDSARICDVTLALDSENQNALWCLLQTYVQTGRSAEAVGAAQQLAALMEPGAQAIDSLDSYWRWYLDWLGRNLRAAAPTTVGLGHLALGERERALQLFEQALDSHASCVLSIGVDPQLDALRGDARFEELLVRIGLRG